MKASGLFGNTIVVPSTRSGSRSSSTVEDVPVVTHDKLGQEEQEPLAVFGEGTLEEL